MAENTFFLKGNIIYSESINKLQLEEDSYVLCQDGLCGGVYKSIPEEYKNVEVYDFENKLIVPGLVDLHVHAPQYGFRGTGMDLQLMDWLNENAFPEEAKFSNLDYAQLAYGMFVGMMRKSATTRLVVFGTKHREATEVLMDLLEKSGLCSYVGKVNMNNLAPENLVEKSADESIAETAAWLDDITGKYKNTYPIITPRFVPSCTQDLLKQLGNLANQSNLNIQSHLSENLEEIKLVKKMFPNSKFYGDVYDSFGLFGTKTSKCIMAHCVHCSDEEIELMKNNDVYVAHCPECNANISSGIAPLRTYIEKGIKVGLGTDIAGGSTESLFSAMTDAIRMSKLYQVYVDNSCKAISFANAFYLATVGGGAFFGKVGAFKPGYEFDAIVLDDGKFPYPSYINPVSRLERFAYIKGDVAGGVVSKFVRGNKVNMTN